MVRRPSLVGHQKLINPDILDGKGTRAVIQQTANDVDQIKRS